MASTQGIAGRIEFVKRHFNFSNEELGKVCGVSYAAIAKIIHGTTKDPSVSIFIKLSEKLDLNIDWLLFGKGELLNKDKQSNTKGHPETVKYLKQEIDNLKLIIEIRESENKTLQKMIGLLEENLIKVKRQLNFL